MPSTFSDASDIIVLQSTNSSEGLIRRQHLGNKLGDLCRIFSAKSQPFRTDHRVRYLIDFRLETFVADNQILDYTSLEFFATGVLRHVGGDGVLDRDRMILQTAREVLRSSSALRSGSSSFRSANSENRAGREV